MPYVATYAPTQDASSFGALLFNETADSLFLEESTDSYGGVVFDLGAARSFNDRGIMLDPPVLITMVLRLVVHSRMVADPGAAAIEVWGVPEYTPVNYTDVIRPFGRSEVLAGTGQFQWTGPGQVFPITLDTAGFELLRLKWWGSSRWTGRLGLSLRSTTPGLAVEFTSTESTGEVPPALLVTEEKPFTGVLGWPTRGARAVRCPKTGLPFLADEAVEDGYHKGLMVSPMGFDPEDRRGKDFYPPPDEGVVKDKVPS